MLLTLSQPARTDFGTGRFIHDFSPRISLAKSRYSPQPPPKVDSPVSSLRASPAPTLDSITALVPATNMTTPHRGLPPPAALTLPDPTRPPPPSIGHPIGPMPAPPSQWQGQEDSMRNWLVAKAEEDRRKQEEEKTKQESYRLEQRRIEQSMLREALQAGIPPTLVPIIYAGLGGAHAVNLGLEWLQQYAAQLQAAAQQQQQPQPIPHPTASPPDLRRDVRLIQPPIAAPLAQQQQVLASQPMEQPPPAGPLPTTFSAYQPSSSRGAPTSAPRNGSHSQLPRLTTNDIYVHQPAAGPGAGGHPLQQSQTAASDQPSSSPNISFHHWVPPAETKPNNPQTPASRGEASVPGSGSHVSDEYRDSPRKRKATGAHQPAPPPSSGVPQYTSPPYSTTSSGSGGRKGGHGRSRSIASTKDSEHGQSRPASRREADTGPRSLLNAEEADEHQAQRPTLPPIELPSSSSMSSVTRDETAPPVSWPSSTEIPSSRRESSRVGEQVIAHDGR